MAGVVAGEEEEEEDVRLACMLASKAESRIVGIGTDLLHLPRLQQLITRHAARKATRTASLDHPNNVEGALQHLSRRILTVRERSDFEHWWNDRSLLDPRSPAVTQWLGLRWAAKEAAYKALFPHYKLTWHDVEVSKAVLSPSSPLSSHPATHAFISPKPSLTFSGSVQSSQDNVTPSLPAMHLSISHDGDFLLAFVVAEQSV